MAKLSIQVKSSMMNNIMVECYRIIELLNGTPGGRSYLGEDTSESNVNQYVIKQFLPPSKDPTLLKISYNVLETETKPLDNLAQQYDKIQKLITFFEKNKNFYLVREYIAGLPLNKEIFPGKTLSSSQVLNILLEVLEILRHNASATHTKKAVGKKKITLRIKSRNLLYFLCVAFSMLIPPDRPDALVSLQIISHDKKNNSLLLGILKNGKFTFKENMDNPEDAKWYIHLVKYKTKKTYGEYWSLPIPNIKFRDGKLFYDYIEDWLKNKRNYNNECNHNYFFRRQIDLEPMTPSDWYTMISTRFINYTFKAIDSTTLRHMYVTELRNRGATDAEKIAAAYAMHHSLEIANNVYNEQEQYEIMIPSENKHMEILSHILE